jgi:hypothetical protein
MFERGIRKLFGNVFHLDYFLGCLYQNYQAEHFKYVHLLYVLQNGPILRYEDQPRGFVDQRKIALSAIY